MLSKKEKFLNLLKNHPEGVTVTEAMKSVKSSAGGIYSIVNTYRNGDEPISIKLIDGKYFLTETKSSPKPKTKPINGNSLSFKLDISKIQKLNPSDQERCMEYAREVIFYKNAIDALISANETVERLVRI